MNAPIQGTAADIMKIAMLGVNRELKNRNMKSRLILQVHDELLIEAYRDEVEEVQMILKTTVSHQQALLECLKSHHPYQTPELLVLPVTHGDTDYLSWLNASLR